ncbi:Aldehyde dehydrogenase, dimeric NADP-preferring [Phlyctochytrium bullatum]|nr:Aldehyde dehydrogenase, dimeric NADP-preferring [Phlyctochytrium bullatum]
MKVKENQITAALNKDHHRQDSNFSVTQELLTTSNELVYALEHLDEWMEPERPKVDPLLNAFDTCEVRKEPLGVVLVIGPWNYPFYLTILPLVSAIAAGNAVVLKPSEVASHTAAVIADIVPQFLDKEAIQVINGGVAETTALLNEKFDHIFYTGNGHVGKIIMTAAAKHLTPVTLELGGKSPVYIHEDANVVTAARRIFWAKTNNSGQTCIAPDYILVHKKAAQPFIEAFRKAYRDLFGEDAQKTPVFSRIINRHHYNRLSSVLDRQKSLPSSRIEVGGRTDPNDLYIEPTLVSGVTPQDPLMEDELFGPMLSLIEVDGEDEAVRMINSRDHPLALYIFTNNRAVAEKIIGQTNSGSVMVNDLLMAMIIPDMPFGGVGPSGMGSYHGKNGFDTFVHRRSTMIRPSGLEFINNVRYPINGLNPSVGKALRSVLEKKLPSNLYLILRRYGVFKKLSWFLWFAIVFAAGFKAAGIFGATAAASA